MILLMCPAVQLELVLIFVNTTGNVRPCIQTSKNEQLE